MALPPDLRKIYGFTDRSGGAGHYIEPGMDSPCWVWHGSRNAHGTPIMWLDGQTVYPHVILWERDNGPKPAGMMLAATCRFLACLRPTHRELRRHGSNLKARTKNK